MHKKKRRGRHFAHSHAEREKKSARWMKYLLVPALAGAAALAITQGVRSGQQGTNTPAPRVMQESDAYGYVEIPLFPFSLSIPRRDILKRFNTRYCSVFVLSQDSKAMAKLESGVVTPVATTLRSKLIMNPPTFVLVKHISPDEVNGFFMRHTAKEFQPQMANAILEAARRHDLNAMRGLSARIRTERPFNEAGTVGGIYHYIGRDKAGFLMEKIADYYIVEAALNEMQGGWGDKERDIFINSLAHEAVHTLQFRYDDENRIPAEGEAPKEVMGYFYSIAYDENPNFALTQMLLSAFYYHIEWSLFSYAAFDPEAAREPHGKLVKALKPEVEAIESLMGRLKTSGPLDILSKSKEEVQKAARAILDDYCMRHYKKPFVEVIPLPEVEDMKRQAAAYYDNEYKGRRATSR